MQELVLDIESYYSTADKFDLKNISVVEYCRDPRFKFHGLGYQFTNEKNGSAGWVSGNNLAEWVKDIDWANTAVIGHNLKFDMFPLTEKFNIRPAQYVCTKAMSAAVLGKTIKNHSLATIAEHFGFEPKGRMKTNGLRDLTYEQEKELSEYCLHDVKLCSLIYNKLKPEFPQGQYPLMSWTIETFVKPVLKLNTKLLEDTAKEEIDRKNKRFAELNIDRKIFSSNKKFPELLQQHGYEVPMKKSPKAKNEDGSAKLIPALALGDEGFLNMLESQDEDLRLICEARVEAKSNLMQTRSQKLAAIGKTGAWPFDIQFSGANQTHRFSGGNGAGGNPQNFTRGSALRKAVEPPTGHHLVVGDFSTIEFRLVAYLSKDRRLIDLIEKGLDPYCDFASSFFERTITKANEDERRFGKTAILGLGYNMGAKKFRLKVRTDTGKTISEEEAKRAVDLYRFKYGGVKRFWNELDQAIKLMTNGSSGRFLDTPMKYGKNYLELPDGLKIRFPNLRQEDEQWIYDVWDKGQLVNRSLYGGKVLENICQGLAGVICKDAAIRFLKNLTGLVHDEIHLVSKTFESKLVAKKLGVAMSISPSWFPKLKLKAEIGYGTNWLESK